jgi:uncharacterized membrane protein YdbT with pleckstrin-like domain
MGYIDSSLGRDEALLYRARFHWAQRAVGWGALIAFALVALFTYWHGYSWLASILLLVGIAVFLSVMVPLWTTEIGVTNQRLIFKRGFLFRSTDEVQLRAIEEVNLEQPVLGRLLGYGRLLVHGTGDDELELPIIADPLALRRTLQDAIHDAQAGMAAPPRAAPADRGASPARSR